MFINCYWTHPHAGPIHMLSIDCKRLCSIPQNTAHYIVKYYIFKYFIFRYFIFKYYISFSNKKIQILAQIFIFAVYRLLLDPSQCWSQPYILFIDCKRLCGITTKILQKPTFSFVSFIFCFSFTPKYQTYFCIFSYMYRVCILLLYLTLLLDVFYL